MVIVDVFALHVRQLGLEHHLVVAGLEDVDRGHPAPEVIRPSSLRP